MTSKLFITFALLFRTFFVNHGDPPLNLVGKYITEKKSLVKRIGKRYLENTVYVGSTTLDLYPDSTFTHKSCGNLITGKWKLDGKNLLLLCQKNMRLRDSSTLTCGNGPWTLEIRNSK
jgi:hypothetical protein